MRRILLAAVLVAGVSPAFAAGGTCKTGFKALEAPMKQLSADLQKINTLPPVPPLPGKQLPDFYMKKSCAQWGHFDFKSLVARVADMKEKAHAISRKCPPRDAQTVNGVMALLQKALDLRVEAARKLCRATGYGW